MANIFFVYINQTIEGHIFINFPYVKMETYKNQGAWNIEQL